MNDHDLTEAGRLLRAAGEILLVSHIRPDGDAVGSLLGLGLALQSAGKQVQMVLADGVPGTFRHLEGASLVQRRVRGPSDLVVVLDCSDTRRLGSVLGPEPAPDLNIDHHVTNLLFGRLNLVDPEAVATAAILAEHLPGWGLPLTRPVADALLTGILTDTLGFRTSNTDARALRTAADLLETGVDLPNLYLRALMQRSYEAVRYWSAGLSRLQREGGLVWTALTLADRQAADYPGRDDADLINVLSAIHDCEVAIIFVEQTPTRVKVSWRAIPGIDVSQVALQFGGGGHPSAAGAELEGELESVQRKVLKASRALLKVEAGGVGK